MNEVMSTANKSDQIPEGLTIRRQGESLEEVTTELSVIKLLSSQTHFELTEVYLKKDARLGLTPAGTCSEIIYVLSGQLVYNSPSSYLVLEPNDYIVTKSLKEAILFIALVDTRVLYITEKSQFHTLSNNLHQLRELAVEVELKDGYTADHCRRLQDLSYATGLELGLGSGRLHVLDYGAYLHDVGKIRVPLSILTKPGKLTPEEWDILKKHPTYGRELLDQTFMREAGTIVEQHHERSDGSGYPYSLAGDEILIESSIVAVADTFDAMTTDRPYRKASTQAEALAEIYKYAGIHYPEEVVKAFCSALNASKLEKEK